MMRDGRMFAVADNAIDDSVQEPIASGVGGPIQARMMG